MLYEDLTKTAVAESVLRLRDTLAKRTAAEVAVVRQLLDNTNPPRIPPEMSSDLQAEMRLEWIPLALARVIVSKLQSAMYGRSLQIDIEGQEENPAIERILNDWRRNAPGIYARALSFGYCVIRFYPDFRKGVTHGVYDPDEVTPVFDPETEDLDPIALIYHYRVPVEAVPGNAPKQVKEAHVLEHITRHNRDRMTGQISEPGTRKRWFSVDSTKWHEWPYSDNETWLNPYGDHLGAVVWRNDDSLNGPWGLSDVLPVRDLLQSISQTCTDLKLLLKWNLWPPIYSSAPGFGDMSYSWRMMWELRPDGTGSSPEVNRLDWDPAALEGGMKYLRLLLQMMHETTSVPAIAMGDLEGLGNLSSGRALEVVMMPLSDLTSRREKLQEWQEQQAIIEMMAVWAHSKAPKDELGIMRVNYGGLRYPDAYDLPISVSFGQLGLAGSTEDTRDYYTQLYGAGLISLMECLSGLHPSWSQGEIIAEHDRLKTSSDSGEGTVVDEGRAARIRQMMEGTTG